MIKLTAEQLKLLETKLWSAQFDGATEKQIIISLLQAAVECGVLVEPKDLETKEKT